VLERLTRRGVAVRLPHLAALRERVGRFHFRPPGGESRCDVVLRVRDVVDELAARDDGHRVLVVTHQIVVNALAYLASDDADDALSTDADGNVPNAHLYMFGFGAATRPVAVLA
ncbi:MAG TPA: histidine phosphatase family protein, partial [Tahibacter sp.]|nr:histidine phosphatase family protein [Tahibacter sp.]